MENYLRSLAARLLRISRASLDISTAKKLRDLSHELDEKAEEFRSVASRRADNNDGNHRSH